MGEIHHIGRQTRSHWRFVILDARFRPIPLSSLCVGSSDAQRAQRRRPKLVGGSHGAGEGPSHSEYVRNAPFERLQGELTGSVVIFQSQSLVSTTQIVECLPRSMTPSVPR